ncbi:MAG: leucyl/phenylalanyl-tRNA--protein transferase [Flavobacteriaceae bacterium]|nr:leucyl/phenylalanyl-tRNA--protein transferase [Flavobacteriaceae bacterium]
MVFLTKELVFPPHYLANEDGLLAIGGDLSTERITLAYQNGIFPWYAEDEPILWWSPDPRMVLFPEKLKVSKSMKQLFKKQKFEVTVNRCFDEVIKHCAAIPRKGQADTWITEEMMTAYKKLYDEGLAYSVETWENQKLVGGLYGVLLKEQQVFCGESMFAQVSNASKYAFIWWVKELERKGIRLIDCQVYTSHLASLGAEEISRADFLEMIK